MKLSITFKSTKIGCFL